MTAETSNAILAIIAIFAAIGNAIAFLVARMELRSQRQETRELTKLAHDLQQQVHRLSVELDQDIQRLYRARESLMKFHAGTASLHALRAIYMGGSPIQSYDKLVEFYGTLETNYREFEGLVKAINNPQLSTLLTELGDLDAAIQGRFANATQLEVLQQVTEYGKVISKIHTRISELIAERIKKQM